jgi:hypothetical protein
MVVVRDSVACWSSCCKPEGRVFEFLGGHLISQFTKSVQPHNGSEGKSAYKENICIFIFINIFHSTDICIVRRKTLTSVLRSMHNLMLLF